MGEYPDDLPYRDPLTPLTPEQRKLRKDVYEKITARPQQLDMSAWELPSVTECKTTRCLAGWTRFLVRGSVYMHGMGGIEHDAIELLGLTRDEYLGDSARTDASDESLADPLFYTSEADATERMRILAGEDA